MFDGPPVPPGKRNGLGGKDKIPNSPLIAIHTLRLNTSATHFSPLAIIDSPDIIDLCLELK